MGMFLESRTLRCGSGLASSESPHANRIGRFELKREIARGGMGIVFEAFDSDLQQSVALKVLHPWSEPEDQVRFQQEARVIARLRHPNIVRVYTLGRDSGRWYLVLDYVDGESLRARLEREGRLESTLAAKLLEPIARAVHYANCRGVVHRDLKPANVLLPRIGGPMLVDFGLAKELAAVSAQPITQQGAVLGTPPYMAPEQALGGTLDSRTDVYGLGATLYRALSGQHPFDGTLLKVLEGVVKHAPTPLVSLAPGVDPRLAAIVERCLAKDPADRFHSAEAVADALAAVVATPVADVRFESSSFAQPPQATFLDQHKARATPAGTRLISRTGLLPAVAALLAACVALPLSGVLAPRSADESAQQVAGATQTSPRPRGASRQLQREQASGQRIRAAAASPHEDLESAEGQSSDHDAPGRLRESGERRAPGGPQESAGGQPSAGQGADGDDDRAPRAAVSLEALASRVALVAERPLHGVLFGGVSVPVQASVAPVVSSRQQREASAGDASSSVGEPSVLLDQLSIEPTYAFEADPPSGAPDPVSQALTAFERVPPTPAANVEFETLLTFDGRAPAYRAVPLQQSLGTPVSAMLEPFGEIVFSAHGRQVDWLFPEEVRKEIELPYDVSGVAVGAGSAFVSLTGPAGSGAGDVYQRTPDGVWEQSFDGRGDHCLTARLGDHVFAFSWSAGERTAVYSRALGAATDGEPAWAKVTELGVERPSQVVQFRGALWLACSPQTVETDIAFYAGGPGGWAPITIEDAGKPKRHQIARVTGLVADRGNLFMTVGLKDATTGVPDGGGLFACYLNEEGELEFERLGKSLRDNDVPLSLAHHERTLYVGTLSGRLLYLEPDTKKGKKGKDPEAEARFKPQFAEESLPGSLGIHSLLPRNNGALMLGQFGPAATEVVLRVPGQ